jgi:hypothetical protein
MAAVSSIAYEHVWAPTDTHQCHLGEGSPKGGGLLGGEQGDPKKVIKVPIT